MVQKVGRSIALLFHDRGIRRGWVVSSTPRPYFTPGKDPYPFYRRLGGSQGPSGRAENLSPPEFDSRTVPPVVSRFTDWATRPICGSRRNSQISCGNQIISVQLKFSCNQYLRGMCSKKAVTYEFLKRHSSANKTDHIQKCLRQKVINTLIPRTSLLWLRCWHGTWVADGTCQTSTLLNIDIKHLFHRDTKVCMLEKKT